MIRPKHVMLRIARRVYVTPCREDVADLLHIFLILLSCRRCGLQGKSPTNPSTAREMGLMLQMRNGPATDEAIKRFNLDSSVGYSLFYPIVFKYRILCCYCLDADIIFQERSGSGIGVV